MHKRVICFQNVMVTFLVTNLYTQYPFSASDGVWCTLFNYIEFL